MVALTWKQLTSIEVGGAICLPVIMVGHKLCSTYGWKSAFLGIVIGNLILFAIASLTVFMSVRHRDSTPENAKRYFGQQGVKLFSILLMSAKLAWFAVQLNMMVLSIQEIFPSFSEGPLTILISLLIFAAAYKGLAGLSFLSSISLPILIVTMGAALFLAEKKGDLKEIHTLSTGAISIAVGAAITAVIDMPTYFRHARSAKDGLIAIGVLFLTAIPLIEGVGVYLAYHNPASTVTETLLSSHVSLWNGWVVLFILLAGWTTNNTNLYSASVCLGTLNQNLNEKFRLLLLTGLGTLLALGHLLDHLTLFLQMLGIFVGSMGSVILSNFLLQGRENSLMSMGAWIFGVLIGLCHLFHVVSITPIAVIDAFLSTSIFILLVRSYETINDRTVG